MTSRILSTLIVAAALLSGAPTFAQTAPAPSPLTAAAETLARSVVSVKMSLKYEGSFGEHEQERETTGVIIDDSGLVLCSNSQTGGVPPSMQDRMTGVTVTPREIKVFVDNDSEGLDAKLIARDSELDLAWIRITDLKNTKLAAVDLTAGATPALGEDMVGVGRLSKYFDRAPMLTFCRVASIVKKPRHLFIPSDMNDLGIPVLTAAGKLVGVTIVQLPEVDEDNDESMRAQLRGLGASMVILPAADVASATKRALETAENNKPSSDKPADK